MLVSLLFFVLTTTLKPRLPVPLVVYRVAAVPPAVEFEMIRRDPDPTEGTAGSQQQPITATVTLGHHPRLSLYAMAIS